MGRLRILLLHAIAYPLSLLIIVAGFMGAGVLLQQIDGWLRTDKWNAAPLSAALQKFDVPLPRTDWVIIQQTLDYLLSWEAPPVILLLSIAIYTLGARTSNRLMASWQSRESLRAKKERDEREAQQRLYEERQRKAQRQREAEQVCRREQAEREREAEQHYRKEAERRQQAEREPQADQKRRTQSERQQAHDTSQDWWTLLGVSADASKDEIVRSYRFKIQQYHPDRMSGLAPEIIELAEKRTRALNAAYAQAKHARRP